MEIMEDEYSTICQNCRAYIFNVFKLFIGDAKTDLCFSCVILLRDLCHEATCEKDVTGICDCFEGEI